MWIPLDPWLELLLDTTASSGADPLGIAGAGHTQLLKQLRTVLLQDATIFQVTFPSHPLFGHAVFRHPAYAAFAEQVRHQHFSEPESEIDLRLHQMVPAVEERLAAMDGWNRRKEAADEQRHAQVLQVLQRHDAAQAAPVVVYRGGYGLIAPTGSAGLAGLAGSSWSCPSSSPTATANEEIGETQDQGWAAGAVASGATTSSSVSMGAAQGRSQALPVRRPLMPPPQLLEPAPAAEQLSAAAAPAAPPATSSYRLSRAVTTVRQLSDEWTIGLNGGPSVEQLNALFKTAWRRGNAKN